MTHARIAPVMGLAMGAMLPFMLHGAARGAGIAFLLAHVAVLAIATMAFLLIPRVRDRIRAHRPTPRMFVSMLVAAAIGFALVCIHCLIDGHLA